MYIRTLYENVCVSVSVRARVNNINRCVFVKGDFEDQLVWRLVVNREFPG